MKVMHRRIATASLDTAVQHTTERQTQAMSTLIDCDEWLIEVAWDGCCIGDAQVYRNKSCGPNGQIQMEPKIVNGEPVFEGRKQVMEPKKDEWVWWGGIPRARIKSYRFLDVSDMKPRTVEEESPLFELPTRGERTKEPRSTLEGGSTAP